MKIFLRLLLSVILPLTSLPLPVFAAGNPQKKAGETEKKAAPNQWELAVAQAVNAAHKAGKSPVKIGESGTELKTWRENLAKAITQQEKSEGVKTGPLNTQFSKFETEYIIGRIRDASKSNVYKLISSLDVKEKEDSAKLVGQMRAAIWKDLDSYNKTAKPGEIEKEAFGRLLDRVEKHKAKPGLELVKAVVAEGGEPPKKEEPKYDECKYKEIFKNKVECAVVEALAGKKGTKLPADPKKLKNDEKTQKKIKAWLSDYLGKGGYAQVGKDPAPKPMIPALKDLAGVFKKQGVEDKELLKFYCEAMYPGGMAAPAAGGEAKKADTKGKLEEKQKKVKDAQKASNIEGATSKALATEDGSGTSATKGSDDPMFARCTNYFNENKRNRAISEKEFDSPPGPPTSIKEPPLTVDAEAKKEEEKKGVPIHKLAIGAGAGAIGFGLLGFILGGPVGAVIGAALGAAVMGGVTWLNNTY